MTSESIIRFCVVEKHAEAINPADGHSRLVLSRLSRGESPIYCATPAIKFVLQGEERYVVGDTEHVVLPGQFLIVEAGTELRAIISRRDTTVGMCMYLPGGSDMPFVDFANPLRQGLGTKGRAVVLSASGTLLGEHLRKSAHLLSSDCSAGTDLAPYVTTTATALLKTMLTDVHSQLAGLPVRKERTRRDLFRQLDLVRAWLHENDHRTVSLVELAHVGGMSQFHLLRSFSSAFGVPPGTFHRKLRLANAFEKLYSGNLDPIQAAERFGFSDERSFRRAFIKQYGISPRLR